MEKQTSPPESEKQGKIDPLSVPQNLSNSNIILIMGILSIVFCWWHFVSLIGIILGIITLIMAHKEMTVYRAHPDRYSLGSLNNVKTGRTCAIIGLTISIIIFVFVLLLIVGLIATLPFWGMIE